MELKDKIVLITASSRGIGFSCVKACAQEGAAVYMAARDPERAKTEAARLNSSGMHVKYVFHDAADPDSYSSLVDTVVRDAGGLDVLVNNFGISDPSRDRDLANTDPTVFLNTVSLNLGSVFRASQAAAKHMARRGGGSIINISSVSGQVADISQIAYGTGKAAINHLTKLIAVQEAANHIRCNAVLPGMTATDSVKKNLTEEFRQLFLKHIPLKRMAQPEEIAAAVVYLAGDRSAYVTGQLLSVSGGFGLATPVYSELLGRKNRR